jgi:hypothetical protein
MIWRACERFHITPPEIGKSWDELDPDAKSMLVAYDQVRQHEEAQELGARL